MPFPSPNLQLYSLENYILKLFFHKLTCLSLAINFFLVWNFVQNENPIVTCELYKRKIYIYIPINVVISFRIHPFCIKWSLSIIASYKLQISLGTSPLPPHLLVGYFHRCCLLVVICKHSWPSYFIL